ncbi:MAG: Ig family protein [Nitrosopumilales archaeon]|nr:MAG: Ig family protein [Nitrosopumilales archaeon]
MHILYLFSLFLNVGFAYGATPFFAEGAFTQNGIEWCEENFQLYQILQEDFFVHHKHSIESRVCVSLFGDPLWTYDGADRYEKLIERSAYYVQLEIEESKVEAETGKIDVTPAEAPEEEPEIAEDVPSSTEEETERETMVTEMQEKSDNGGGCLIATATFGSELAPQVQQLRELRDNSLLQTDSGTTFMSGFNQFYYLFSPTIADWERQSPIFKEAVKLGITPLIASLSILNYVDIDSEAEMLGYGISLIMLNVGMYFVAPAMIIIHLKKRF